MWRSINSIEKRWVKSKMHNPKISIITVSYNAAKTIEQTILSVVNQTYPNIEYVIIDGGSTDGTIDIIKKYEDQIAYWVSEPDNGIYDAMNKGIDVAIGDYIFFLGADDTLTSANIIEEVAVFICKYIKSDQILCGKVFMIDNNTQMIKENTRRYSLSDIKSGAMPPHQGMFMPKCLLDEKIHFDINYNIAADFEVLLKNIMKGIQVVFFDKNIAYYSINGCSANKDILHHEYAKIIKKYCGNENSKIYLLKYQNKMKKIIKTILKILVLKKLFKILTGWKFISKKNNSMKWYIKN